MKHFESKVELASKLEDLNKCNRRQRRFVATVTQKIVDKQVATRGISGDDNA
jgi:hypothetical protein